MAKPDLRNWHRIFGLMLSDQLAHTGCDVQMEIDVSKQEQLLDIVVIRPNSVSGNAIGQGPQAVPFPMPDGMEVLAEYNLITFKSYHEPLDDWALKELIGHYVAYRKLKKTENDLLPEDRFKLFAVCARTPEKLMRQIELTPVREGVYDARRGTDTIRVVVANELPKFANNAFFLLFSAQSERVEYGRTNTTQQSVETSQLIHELFGNYRVEGMNVPYTMEDFRREHMPEILQTIKRNISAEQLASLFPAEEFLKNYKPEDVLKNYKPEDVLKNYKPEDVLKNYKPEERLQGLKPEERLQGLKPEERLQGLKPEDVLLGMKPDVVEAIKNLLSK
jgi:hypothetical protein